MLQPGFFDLAQRYDQLSDAGDPLVKLNEVVDWEGFRPILEGQLMKERKSNAGRKPYDCVLMFKILVLQSLYNLSDHQIEYQIRDRLSFMRFLGLEIESRIPDEKTVWLFREQLTKGKALPVLFKSFNAFLERSGFKAESGQIIDASIVEVPKQRNNGGHNKEIKEHNRAPKEWETQPSKLRQKDIDARWTKKNYQSYYGYKDHIEVDTKHKLIREFAVSPACESDTHYFEELLDPTNKDKKVWADKTYHSAKSKNPGCNIEISLFMRVGLNLRLSITTLITNADP